MTSVKKWRDENDETLADMWGDRKVSELAQIFGVSAGSIYAHARRLNLGPPPTGYRVPPIVERVDPVAFDRIASKIVAPGIEKHLIPLLHFRGSADIGRVHRLWNLTLALKETEVETTSDAMALVNHPKFAHLCEPRNAPGVTSLNGFWSRLIDKPVVCNLEPGLHDYVRSMIRFKFNLMPVSEVAGHTGHAWWRTYKPRDRLTPEERAKREAERLRPRATELMWPYIAHDPKKTDVGGTDIVALVNSIVSKNIPEENRADICQDLILAVLEGKYSVDDIRDNPKKYISAVRDTSPWKYEWVSMDAPLFGDGRALHEVIAG